MRNKFKFGSKFKKHDTEMPCMILDWILNWGSGVMKGSFGEMGDLNMYHVLHNSSMSKLYFLKLKVKLWLYEENASVLRR